MYNALENVLVLSRRLTSPNCGYCGKYVGYRVNENVERHGRFVYHLQCYNEKQQDLYKYRYSKIISKSLPL